MNVFSPNIIALKSLLMIISCGGLFLEMYILDIGAMEIIKAIEVTIKIVISI